MQPFHAEMEARFGNETALGIVLVCYKSHGDTQFEVYPAAAYDALPAETRDSFMAVASQFPNGLSATCCTNYAMHIFTALPGRVQIYGFSNDRNPMSRVARDGLHPGGHDFAVVDGRYIVDPWIRLVAGEDGPIVLDRRQPADAVAVIDTYGPQDCWGRMLKAEQFAQASMLPAPVPRHPL